MGCGASQHCARILTFNLFIVHIVKKKLFKPILFITLLFLPGIWILSLFPSLVLWNITNVHALRAYFSSDLSAKAAAVDLLKQQLPTNCQANWLLSRLKDQEPSIYLSIMECSQDYWPLVSNVYPTKLILAKQAVTLKPQSEMAWLWLAQAQKASDPVSALSSYINVASLNPYNGLAWCQIGNIYENQANYIQAEEAYLNCCKNEDPGLNGCYGAGRMAEISGDTILAIKYYRMSIFSSSIDRANELEKQLKP